MRDYRRIWRLPAACAAALLLGAPLAAMPEEAGSHLTAARQALVMGDAILAEAEAHKALSAGAARRDVVAVMGEALLNQGRPDRARDWLQPADFSASDAAYGWRILGRVEVVQGNLREAARAFDKAIALKPKDAQLWVDIGRLRYIGGQHALALDAADRALAANPKHPRALQFRAELARDAAGYAAAEVFYRRAMDSAPADPAIALGLAAALGDAGQAAAMLEVLRDQQHRAAGSPLGFYYQAVLAARAGDIETARRVFNRTTGKLAATPSVKLFGSVLELEAGNPSVASIALDELVRDQPDNQTAQLLFARALYESGEHQRLVAAFGAMAARPDAPAYLLTLLGRSYEERGEREAAAAYLDRAAAARGRVIAVLPSYGSPGSLAGTFSSNPANAGAAVRYIRALIDTADNAGARAAADRFRQARPNMVEALGAWGDVALADRRYNQAFAAYDRSAQVRLTDQLVHRMTVALEGMGRAFQAQGLAARYLAAFPSSTGASRAAAGYAAGQGDWHAASALLKNLLARGSARDVQVLADLSFAQLQSGDADAALATAEQAAALQPANPQAAQARALALVALAQDKPAARAALDKALALGSDNPLLAKARAVLSRSGSR